MQASPRAQDQQKGLKLSDTKATGLQGKPELAGENGEMQSESCLEAEF